MAPATALDIDGSTVRGGHLFRAGTKVRVTRGGVDQRWDVTVFRQDRNRTYRLAFANGSYVTAHEHELEVIE